MALKVTKSHGWKLAFFFARPRDEAASATVRSRNRTYAIGGMGERTVEFIDMTDFVMPSGDDPGTGMEGEPAVFDARYHQYLSTLHLMAVNLLK